MATWSRHGINPWMMHSEGMYLPQCIPVLVSGAWSPMMVCYYIHLPANSLHLIPVPLMTQNTSSSWGYLLLPKKLHSVFFPDFLFPRNQDSSKLLEREPLNLGILLHDPHVTGSFTAEGSYNKCHWKHITDHCKIIPALLQWEVIQQ